MSSWAQTTPRTFLLDVNRSRFSINQPATENYPESVGPGAYNPAIVKPKVRGQVALHKTQDGVSERVKEIYGTPTSKILPIHALSYDPKGKKISPFDAITATGEVVQQTFRSQSPRQLWPTTDQTKNPEEYPPGPNTYALPPPSVHSSTPRAPTVFVQFEARQSNSPVQKEPLPTLPNYNNSTISSYSGYLGGTSPRSLRSSPAAGGGVSPNAAGGASPMADTQGARSTASLRQFLPAANSPRNLNGSLLGGSIGRSPRHLNIHNLNSLLPREKDPDYDNPSPAAYEVAKQTTSFGSSPQKRH